MSKFTHDLNNLLTVIQGYSELARTRLPPDHPARPDLDEVIQAASSAVRLVLDYSDAEHARADAKAAPAGDSTGDSGGGA